MLDSLKNATIYRNKYKTHSEAVIISCFFNPQNSPYRLKAFNYFYNSIKHLNHRIIECVIGDSKPQLPENENISRVYTETLLWHKESLLNKIVSELPQKFKYVFWIDADVIFTNKNWLVDGVKELENKNIIQPFELCVHLDKDEYEPSIDVAYLNKLADPNMFYNKSWKSFCYNFVENSELSSNENYDVHGHVGFAWGARREVLDSVPLYDRALIGGADHIIAHAAAGQIGHKCITKSFTENIDEVNEWSKRFYFTVNRKIGYVKGNLYHIWHGDIKKREYLKRIQEFTPTTKNINKKDKNGLYVASKKESKYVEDYFQRREVTDDLLNTMMLYSLLNNNNTSTEQQTQDFGGFNGGDFGGAGSGGSFDNNENFS